MSKDVILTGLRANNDLHIGNYFGALLPIIDMAKQRSGEFDVHLFVPDLHSFRKVRRNMKPDLHNMRLRSRKQKQRFSLEEKDLQRFSR